MTCGAQLAACLRRSVIVGRVAGETSALHWEQFVVAVATVAFSLPDVQIVVERHRTEPIGVSQGRVQRGYRTARSQLGMAFQAIVFGGKSRSIVPMTGATGSFVLFGRSMQIIGISEHAFGERKDLVVTASAISFADIHMASMIKFSPPESRLDRSRIGQP